MSNQEPRTVANMPCPLPPEGWYCTRPAGHDGPCAAVEYPQETRTGDNVIGQCPKCGRAWLAGHVCGEMSEQSRAALDDVVTASIAAAKRLFPDEKGEPVVVMHAPEDPRTGGVAVYECPKCHAREWCLATEGERPGHRQPPADGDMSTEDDWCDGVAEVVAIEFPLAEAEALLAAERGRDAALTDVARLRPYVRHFATCSRDATMNAPCTCGLSNALKEAPRDA